MADATTLATQLAQLEAARASGVLTVEYDGRPVTYRSDAELAGFRCARQPVSHAVRERPDVEAALACEKLTIGASDVGSRPHRCRSG